MKKIFFATLLLLVSSLVGAQSITDSLPIDPQVRKGVLPNGLTYYIRHNEQPKQRAEFHIAQAVGAILEEDDQNGLAHFLEHMAFNGTEHFAGKGIINYFESIGVSFGGDINAYTALDETVYRLSNVPTVREGIIDSALLVMHDWACGLSLLAEEIDAERGVIREEWRTRSDANRRMWSASNPQKYPNSQYAKRDVIGDTAVINNFDYDVLRRYYKKWYGPDNQAIVVVGDIDVDKIEAKIKELWANVPARENRGERPLYSVNDNVEPLVAIVHDGEAQYTRIEFEYKKPVLPKEMVGTLAQYIVSLQMSVICDMLNNRFEEIIMQPTSPFMYVVAYYGGLVKEKDAFQLVVIAKNGQEKEAFTAVLTQLEKMRRYGFTVSEFERAKEQVVSDYEKAYNERNNQQNIKLTREYIRNFLDNECILGIEYEYEFVKNVLPMLNLEQFNTTAKALVTDENQIVAFLAPENVALPDKMEVRELIAQSKNQEIEAPVEEQIDRVLVKKEPKAGKVSKIAQNESLGTTEWTLKNGVKVVFKPTEFKQDEILFSAFSKGGKSLVTAADIPSAELATELAEFSGLGDFSYSDLQKALSGKKVALSPSIGDFSESLSGYSTVKDLETLLQLNYLMFTAPRFDADAYQTLLDMLRTQMANRQSNPQVAWSDSVTVMSTNHSERTYLLNEDFLSKIDLKRAEEIYKQRFANAADFVFMFTGNINPNDAATKKLICKWLGGLKTCKKHEAMADNGERVPEGKVTNQFERPMQTRTASNYIQFTSYDIPCTVENIVTYRLIGSILSTRYLESIREREGGSYGVASYAYQSHNVVDETSMVMYFDTDPEKQQKLLSIIYAEIDSIVENGPLAVDLQKEREIMLKSLQDNREKNEWWHNTVLARYYQHGFDYVRDYEKAVRNVTAEDIQKALKTLVENANVFEVIMMPK